MRIGVRRASQIKGRTIAKQDPEELSRHETELFDGLIDFAETSRWIPDSIRVDTFVPKPEETARGFWESSTRTIYIQRALIRNPAEFFATLHHELAHARSGAPDVSQEFEEALSRHLGLLAAQHFQSRAQYSAYCIQGGQGKQKIIEITAEDWDFEPADTPAVPAEPVAPAKKQRPRPEAKGPWKPIALSLQLDAH